jgi:xylulose-5-phosphate/fructose-6-phosphate phosphoketolase
VRNEMSRYDLCLEALRRVPEAETRGAALADHCRAMLERHERYIREHLEDMPDVRDWCWTEP